MLLFYSLIGGSLLALCQSQAAPPSFPLLQEDLPEQRPPPVQDFDYVQDVLDDLLEGRTPQLSFTNTVKSVQRSIDPWALVNTSAYWFSDSLQPEMSIADQNEAAEWLSGYLGEAEKVLSMATEAGWNYFTNITEYNREVLVDSEQVLSSFLTSTALQAKQFRLAAFSNNSTLQRLMHMLSIEGMNALDPDEQAELDESKRALAAIIHNAAVCEQGRAPPCTMRYPQLQSLLPTTRSPSQLLYLWLAWRQAAGAGAKRHYSALVRVSNTAARLNGYADAGELWRSPYELAEPQLGSGKRLDLREMLNKLWSEIRPLYAELHAYVRRRLAEEFDLNAVPQLTSDGPIPAHLLGTLSADSWASLYEMTMPDPESFADGPSLPWASDPIGDRLTQMGYNATSLFKKAEELFTSMGLEPLPERFWNNSVFARPWDRDMLCYPWTAFDFRNTDDYRVKACADQLSETNLIEAHKLLAQSHYQLAYGELPLPFREAANPSFASAIAGAIGLATGSRPYWQTLGIDSITTPGPSFTTSGAPPPDLPATSQKLPNPSSLNGLYLEALEQLVNMPYTLAVDMWRWKVFEGRVNESKWNDEWWMMRYQYQGIGSPVQSTGADFDPAGSAIITQQHFPATRQFISYVLQFQVLKSLCEQAGYGGPLNISRCNLYGSPLAGERLQMAMSLGSSMDWPDVLSKLTGGTETVSAQALLDYYQPLMQWLQEENRRLGNYVGWDGTGKPFENIESFVPAAPGSPPHPNENSEVLQRHQVAYAGESCVEGEFCLSESTCNGTHCECTPPLVRYDQFCLPNDPRSGAFGLGGDGDQDGNELQGSDGGPSKFHVEISEIITSSTTGSPDLDKNSISAAQSAASVPFQLSLPIILLFVIVSTLMNRR